MLTRKIKKILSFLKKSRISLLMLFIFIFLSVETTWLISQNFQPQLVANINNHYKIGQIITGDNYSFTVQSVRYDIKGAGPLVPKDGYKFVIPNIIIKNNSNSEFEFIPFLFLHVKDSNGNVYTNEAIISESNQFSGLLLGGDVLQEEVGFSVPQNATGLTLFFETGTATGNQIAAINLESEKLWWQFK
jgi:hypothetical protein